MDVRLRSDLTRKKLAMGVFEGKGNISENCDKLQKDKLQNARDEMQDTLMKIMAKIFSAKVVIKRLPDIDRRENPTNNEKDPELEDDKENVLKECKILDTQMRSNCTSSEYSGCNSLDESCTDAIEIADKNISDDQTEDESNVLDTKRSNRQSFLQYYHKFCPDCSETQISSKRIAKCQNCNLRWHYECKICCKQLSTYDGIVRHLIMKCIAMGHYFACFKCDFKAAYKHQVKFHLKKAHSIVNALNRIEKFKSENVQNDTSKTARLKCSKCERPFEKLPQLLRHLQLCGQKQYSAYSKKLSNTTVDKCFHHCVKCNRTVKKCKTGGFYGKECPTCHEKYSFKCKQCDKIFISYNSIHLHLKIHHNTHSEDEFKCPECDYKTSLIEYLSRHIRRRHTNESYECPNCGRKYTTRVACRDHIRYCKREVEFKCDLCPRKFKTKTHVQRHIFQVHTDGNEIDCPQCGTKLKNKYSLSFHLTYCKKEALYQCMKCPFKTKYKIELRRHQKRVHSKVQTKNEDENELML